MALTKKQIQLAVRNIAQYGDTDVFPFPIENHIFYDKEEEVLNVIDILNKNFDEYLSKYPPVFVKNLTVVGYHGFRSATQIDPMWNAYFLSLVLSIAKDLENARIPSSKNTIFSYRFNPDSKKASLFDNRFNYRSYQEESIKRARSNEFVLITDIADFYSRIYHHRIENALYKATKDTNTIKRIMTLLNSFSGNVSYGLPIGGPAARILCEILLNRTDRLLVSEKIQFCRFVDDMTIFANSKEEAYSHLVTLSQLLLENEGLSLQRAKTRIITREEYLKSSNYFIENKPESTEEKEIKSFVSIRLQYDPYSPTADEDYKILKSEIEKFDIVGLLGREIRKPRIDEMVTKQLIKATKYLSAKTINDVVLSLISSLNTLYPIFPTVMIFLKAVLKGLNSETKEHVFTCIRELIDNESYITQVQANLAYALRVLSLDKSEESEAVLIKLYKKPLNMMLKRDIILILANQKADHWISNYKRQYQVLTAWEKTALLISSYILGDEGKHWRKSIKNELSPLDKICLDWASRKNNFDNWEFPL